MASDTSKVKKAAIDRSGESTLRGPIGGSERSSSVDNTEFLKTRDPDAVLRVDDEEDDLYDDGLDLEDDSKILTNTPKNGNIT